MVLVVVERMQMWTVSNPGVFVYLCASLGASLFAPHRSDVLFLLVTGLGSGSGRAPP